MGRLSRGEVAEAEAAAAAATAAAAAAAAVTTEATQAGSYTVFTTAAAPCVVGTHYTMFTAVAASCVLSAREPGPHNSIHCCGLHSSNHCLVRPHCQGGAAAAVVTTVSRPPACASRPWNREDVGACCCWWRGILSRAPSHSPRVSGGLLGVATDHWSLYYHTMGGNNTHHPTVRDGYAQTLWKYHLTTKK